MPSRNGSGESRRAWGCVREALLGGALACCLGAPTNAVAQAIDEASAITMLAAADRDEVRLGIETLGLSGSPRAATALGNRVLAGLDPELLDVALTTLSVMSRPEAAPALVRLTRHRRPDVRARALEALAAMGAPGSAEALVRGLGDGSELVRGAAARGLGELGDRAHVPLLLRAFEHGIAEAAAPIGKLGDPEQIRALLRNLGRVPLAQVAPGLTEALLRADLPVRLRLDVVARLHELATGEVRTYLERLLTLLPTAANDPVRRAVEEAITRIAG